MAKDIATGWVATTDRVAKYGGVALAESALEQMAVAMRGNQVPVHLQHDALRPIEAYVLLAEVREMPNGKKGLWVEMEVPAGAMEGMRAFSIAASTTTERLGPPGGDLVGLYADAGAFSETELRDAATRLAGKGFRVEAGPYYMFSIDPVAVAIVVQVAVDLLVSVAGAGLYDAIRGLLKAGRKTEIRFEIERPGAINAKALVRTDDPEVAKQAIESLASVAIESDRLRFEDGQWQDAGPPRQPPRSE